VTRSKLARHTKQSLSRAVNCPEDVLVFAVIYNRGVEGESYSSKQHARYCQSKQQFCDGKTAFVFRMSYIVHRISF
jgi:hypothetical protein